MDSNHTCPTCHGEKRAGVCPRCFYSAALGDRDLVEPEYAPEAIDSYEFIEEIARGGMGVVWRARQKKLGRDVAVKLLREDVLAGESAARRFRIEGEAIAQLHHPHIVAVYEVGETGDRSFLSMELLEGGTLAGRLKNGPLPSRDAVELLVKIARAVHFAHERGILHRDLKPANILFDDAGEPRVCDFGLARVAGSDAGLTLSGAALGTPAYMPPEQAAGRNREITTVSDVYGLGAILYEALTGQPPFGGDTQLEVLRRVTDEEPIRPSSIVARMDRDLETICLKCLEKSPAARYPSALTLAEDLGRWLLGEPIRARAVTTPERLWKWALRHPAWAALWVTCTLSLGGIAAISSYAWRSAEASIDRLRATAPAFYAQAKGLRDAQRLKEAEEKIATAIELQPKEAAFHLLRGQLAQSQLRLPEAMESFHRALALNPGEPSAVENLELCKRLWPLTPLHESMLLDALISQRRSAESVVLSRAIGHAGAADRLLIESRLADLHKQAAWEGGQRLDRLPDGTWSLNLKDLDITELSFLSNLPISRLSLEKCQVADLRPLASLPLQSLNLAQTKVIDLQPLAKLQLRELSVWKTQVKDLKPLTGMPLEDLSIGYCPIGDLAPLSGLPLKKLDVDGVRAPDFSMLFGMPLTWLQARDSSFSDLSVLTGKSIGLLRVGHTTVTDLAALSGMPLVELDLGGCEQLLDLSPLDGMKTLQRLLIPAGCGSASVLRNLPALQRLGDKPYERYGWKFAAVPTTADFFARYAGQLAEGETVIMKVRALQAELRRLGVQEVDLPKRIKLEDGAYRIDLTDLPFDDLSLIVGIPARHLNLVRTAVVDIVLLATMPLESLNISQTGVRDLTPLAECKNLKALRFYITPIFDLRPLAGLPLEEVLFGTTHVADLTPLAGLPIERLMADHCPLNDVTPLLSCPTLRMLCLDRTAPGLEKLRALPNLQYIDDNWHLKNPRPALTAAEFWASFETDSPKGK